MSAPFMQLYVADYLGDTRHLTTEQHGAYLLLLMTMWRADGRLPNDDKKLARIASCPPSRWAKIKDEVMEFFVIEGDEITNQRLMFELKKASEKSIKRAEAGTKGGRAKSLKSNKTDQANARRLPEHSSEPEPDTTVTNVPVVVLDRPKRRGGSTDFDAFWTAYPKKKSKDTAAKAFAKAMSRIADPDPLAVILAGIERALPGWDDPQFIPYPATWLNAAGWEDEAPTPRPAQRTRHDRPDAHRPSKLDHLDDIARAMAASRHGAVEPDRGDRFDPGAESGGCYLPPAA